MARCSVRVLRFPNRTKVVAENERVRVSKATVEAGDKGVMHEHPDRFVVFLTDAKVRFGLADGTTLPETARKAGAVPPPSGAGVTRTPIVSGPHGEAVLLKTSAGFAEPAGSTHDYDAVVVPMTGSGAELTIDGKTVTMKKGEAYLISRGAPHAVQATAGGETVVVYIK